jgi:Asp-tRNA(Asn)/Glu-tRNA(Gln) amidotransferase A subunit family amidase
VEAIYQQAIERLTVLGAQLVDPVEYTATPAQRGAAYRIMLREFKAGLNDYLAARDLPDDRDSLADLIEFNRRNRDQAMPIFGQSIFLEAAAMTGLDDPAYENDLQLAQETLRTNMQNLFEANRLDALFMPATGPAWKTDWINGDSSKFGGTAYLAAITGYPGIVLPAGIVDHLPVSVGFMGLKVIQIAYALEQSLPRRAEPRFLPTLEEPTLEEPVPEKPPDSISSAPH